MAIGSIRKLRNARPSGSARPLVPGLGREALAPARWPRRPAGAVIVRAALVATLLALAAGVLYSGEPGRPCPATAGGAAAASSPGSTSPGSTPSALSTGRLTLPAGLVGVPVRLAEPAALAVVQPGLRVDLLAAAPGTSAATRRPILVASRALVLDVLDPDRVNGVPALYLALRPEQAEQAVGMPDDTRFTIVIR